MTTIEHKVSFSGHFRSTPINRHSQGMSGCLKCATCGLRHSTEIYWFACSAAAVAMYFE
jgi:hypothetical protein